MPRMVSDPPDVRAAGATLWLLADPGARDDADIPSSSPAATVVGLALRDLRVLRRDGWSFAARVLLNPLLFLFVFTYVLPTIGAGFVTVGSFATILFPGLLAVALFAQSATGVALALALELSLNREIEDRVMVPIPLPVVAATKVALGAARGVLATILVAPFAYIIPAGGVQLHVSNWPLLIGVLFLGAVASASVGLVLGVALKPKNINLIFSAVLVPLTFLGCVYYPWASLSPLPWLQYAVLVNPLVYIAEGLRAAMTPQLPHMPVLQMMTALIAITIVAGAIGIHRFVERLVS